MEIILERTIYIGFVKTEYKITNDGKVISLKGGKRKYLKIQKYRHGYLYVNLWVNGICYRDTIHRLVAKAFIPNPNNLPEVNHIDGDKENNCVNNLEWSSSEDNVSHAWYNNLCSSYGENSHLNKFKEEYIIKVCEMLMEGLQPREISELTGISQAMVSDIRGKKIWKHITKQYNFPDRELFNYSSKYPYDIKNKIAILCMENKSNKEIREVLNLPHTNAIRSMIDRVRNKMKNETNVDIKVQRLSKTHQLRNTIDGSE